ncbi:MAG: GYD domain-containing protein, partial [Cryomorphaceae bacterium]|nr:GYD domain-containing protein [Cryomorphaceae bacterium]
MGKFYVLGRYTDKGLAGFVNNPNTDRKAATTALCDAAGAKLVGYAGLRGKYDFMVEVEGTFDQAAASGMVAVSS